MKYSEMLKKSKEKGASVDLTPSYFEFKKEGTNIVGRLLGFSPVKSGLSEGFYNQYLMDTDGGLMKFHLGGAADKEIVAQLKIGEVYFIEYLGKAKISGARSVNKFRVMQIDPSLSEAKDVPF